ncbi:MAG: M20/M25/M40 family metallo-hydrolase [Acidobacteriota bacterium]
MSNQDEASQLETSSPPVIGLLSGMLLPAIILGAAVLGIRSVMPPGAVPATAPERAFSSERAMRHVAAIAQEPHPIGTPEHTRVREYLVEQIRAAGLTPVVWQTVALDAERLSAGTVQNVMARMKGTCGRRAIMLSAHYDSAPTAPGAADDAAGVAALLETMRALRASPPLQNDVIFLFDDGEEVGLLGARAFVAEHPWARDVGMVLNLEARGHKGPSIMYETSEGNSRLIDGFASAVPSAVSASWACEVSRRLPNDTSFTPYRKAGLAGLNFAFIDGATHYHTLLDNPGNLDHRSLQHHGEQALAITRHFGNVDLTQIKGSSDAVYFNLPWAGLVHYSTRGAWPLAGLSLVLFAVVAFVGLRAGRLTLRGLGFAALAAVIGTAAGAGAAALAWRLISRWHPEYASFYGHLYNGGLYQLGLTALCLGVFTGVYALLQKRTPAENLAMGGLTPILILALLSAAFVPGLSYLFVWPVIAGLVALHITPPRKAVAGAAAIRLALAAVSALPAALLFAPAVYLLFAATGSTQLAAASAMTGLMLCCLVPQVMFMTESKRFVLPVLALVVAMVSIVWAERTSGFDQTRPIANRIIYFLDSDRHEALWSAFDEPQDEWTAQFLAHGKTSIRLSDFFPINSTRSQPAAPAPVLTLPAPGAALMSDELDGDRRKLRLRVTSPRMGRAITLFTTNKCEVLAAAVNGKEMTGSRPHQGQGGRYSWAVNYYAPPPDGLDVQIEVRAGSVVELGVIDRTDGLPPVPPGSIEPRRAWMIDGGDRVLVRRTFRFS